MAGDWIPIRIDIHEDPDVLKLARLMGSGTRPEVAVGYLVRFWGWVSRSTDNGVIQGAILEDIESVLNMPNFLGYLQRIGWLEYIESTDGPCIIIPNFDTWLSESAKKRVKNTAQKRKKRSESCPRNVRKKTDKTRTTEEKRREENKDPQKPPKGAPAVDASLPFTSDAFQSAWGDWCQHRKEIKKKLTPTSVKQQFRKFEEWGEAKSIEVIRYTIEKGWQGLREPETNGASKPKPEPRPLTPEEFRQLGEANYGRPLG